MPLWVKAWSRAQFGSYSDPPLTDCAIERAQAAGPKILERIKRKHVEWVDKNFPIMVFSSQMLRAIETAMYNFEGTPVYPIPHIAEEGLSLDNFPKTWNISRPLRIGDAEDRVQHITFIEGVNNPFGSTPSELSSKSDYAKFKKHFPKILTDISAHNGIELADINSSMPIPLVIVSHSSFMAHQLACQKGEKKRTKPANNQAWMQEYTVDDDGMKEGDCEENVLPPEELAKKTPKVLCAGMVDRCREDFKPTYLLQEDAKACSEGKVS